MLRKNSKIQDYILKVPMYMKYSQKELIKSDQWMPGGKCGNNSCLENSMDRGVW